MCTTALQGWEGMMSESVLWGDAGGVRVCLLRPSSAQASSLRKWTRCEYGTADSMPSSSRVRMGKKDNLPALNYVMYLSSLDFSSNWSCPSLDVVRGRL